MKKVLLIAILAAAFVGCEENNTPESSFIPTGVYFSYGSEDTRTAVSVENGGSYFTWNSGDKLGISCTQGEIANKALTVPAAYDGKRVMQVQTGIEFNGKYADHTFNLYYPYNSSNTTPSFVRSTLPATQNGKVGNSDFMWDQITTTVDNPVVSSTMKHPFAYVRFWVVATGNVNDAAVAGKKVNAISITADKGPLAGEFTADFNNFKNNKVTFAGSTSNTVTLNAPMTIMTKEEYAAKTVDGTTPVMIINPEGVSAKFDVTVFIDGSTPITTSFDMSGKAFKANNFYNIGLGGSFESGKFTLTVIDWERVTADVTFN